jgi:hypothetical protein
VFRGELSRPKVIEIGVKSPTPLVLLSSIEKPGDTFGVTSATMDLLSYNFLLLCCLCCAEKTYTM